MELDSEGINSQEEVIICKETSQNDDYEVEKITGMRLVKGKIWFRVRWKGYGADMATWEPKGNLNHCEELLEHYVSKVQAKKYKQKKRRQIQTALIHSIKKDQKDDDTKVNPGVNNFVQNKVQQFNGTIMRKRLIKKFISKPNKFSNQTNKWSLNENPLELVSMEELPLETSNAEEPIRERIKKRRRGRPKKKTSKMPDLQPQTQFSLDRETCHETESQLRLDTQTCLQPQTQLCPNRETSLQQETCVPSKSLLCPEDTETCLQPQTLLCSGKETCLQPGSRLCSDRETRLQPKTQSCPEIAIRLQPTSKQCPESKTRLQPHLQPCPDREPLETVDDIILLEDNSVSEKKRDSVVKRGRGRPPKKKNQKKLHEDLCIQKNPTNIRRKRGRPKKAVAHGRVTKAKTYDHYNGQIKLKKVVIRELRSLKALLEFQRQISDEEKENKTDTYTNKEEEVPSTLEHRHVLASEYRNRFFIRIKTGSFKDQSTKRRRKRKEDKEKRKKKREARRMMGRTNGRKGKKELSDVQEICHGVEEDGMEECALPEMVEISSSSEAGEREEESAESQMDAPARYGYDDLTDFSKENNSFADLNNEDITISADVQEITEEDNVYTDRIVTKESNILQDVMTLRPKNSSEGDVFIDKEEQETKEDDEEEAAAAADDESSSLVIPFDEEEEESSSLIIADGFEDDDDDDDDLREFDNGSEKFQDHEACVSPISTRESVEKGEQNGIHDVTRDEREQCKKKEHRQKSFEDTDSDEFIFENSSSDTSETPQILEEENNQRMSSSELRREKNKMEMYDGNGSPCRNHEDIADIGGEGDAMQTMEPMDLTFTGDSVNMVENRDIYMDESEENANFEESESEVNSSSSIEMEMDKTEKSINVMTEDNEDRPTRASQIQVLDKCMEEEDFELEMKTSEIFLKTRKDKGNHQEEKEEANGERIAKKCTGYRDLEARDDQSEPQVLALCESEKMKEAKKKDKNKKMESGLESHTTTKEHTLQENSDVMMMDSGLEDEEKDITNKGDTCVDEMEGNCKDNHLRTDANVDFHNPEVAELVKEAENELMSLSIGPSKPLKDNPATEAMNTSLISSKNDEEVQDFSGKEECYCDQMEMQEKGLSETKELDRVSQEGKEVESDVVDPNQSPGKEEIQDGERKDAGRKENDGDPLESQGIELSETKEPDRTHQEHAKQDESDRADLKESTGIEVVQDGERKDTGRKEENDDDPFEPQGMEPLESKELGKTHQEHAKQDESDRADLKESTGIEVVQDGERKETGKKEENGDDPFEPQGIEVSETKESDRTRQEDAKQDEPDMSDTYESAEIEVVQDGERKDAESKEKNHDEPFEPQGIEPSETKEPDRTHQEDAKQDESDIANPTESAGKKKVMDQEMEQKNTVEMSQTTTEEGDKEEDEREGGEDDMNKDHEKIAAIGLSEADENQESCNENIKETKGMRELEGTKFKDEDEDKRSQDLEKTLTILPIKENEDEKGGEACDEETMETEVGREDRGNNQDHEMIAAIHSIQDESKLVSCDEEINDTDEKREVQGINSIDEDDEYQNKDHEKMTVVLPASIKNARNEELGSDQESEHTKLAMPQKDIETRETEEGENQKEDCDEEMENSNDEREIEGLKSKEQVACDDKMEGDSEEIKEQVLISSRNREIEGIAQAEENDLETAAAVKMLERELGIDEGVEDERNKFPQRDDNKMNPEITLAEETEEYDDRDKEQRRVDDEEMQLEIEGTHGIAEKEIPKVEASLNEDNVMHQRDIQNLKPESKTIKEVETEQMDDVGQENEKEIEDQEKDEQEKEVKIPESTSIKTAEESNTEGNGIVDVEERGGGQIDAKTITQDKDKPRCQEEGDVAPKKDKTGEEIMFTNSVENLIEQGITKEDLPEQEKECSITKEETAATAAIENGADNGSILEKEKLGLSVKDKRDLGCGKVEHKLEKVMEVMESEDSKATCVHEEKIKETPEGDKVDNERTEDTGISMAEDNLHAFELKRRNGECRPNENVKNLEVASQNDHIEIKRLDKETFSEANTGLAKEHLNGTQEKLTGTCLDNMDNKEDTPQKEKVSNEAVANLSHGVDMKSINEGFTADKENECDNNRIPSPKEATQTQDKTNGNLGNIQEDVHNDKLEVFEKKTFWNSDDALDVHVSMEEIIEVSGKTIADTSSSNLEDTPDKVDLHESKESNTSTEEGAKTVAEELEEGELPEDDEEDSVKETDSGKEEGEITEDIEDPKDERRTRMGEIENTTPIVTEKSKMQRQNSEQVRRRSQEAIDVTKIGTINSDHQTTHGDVEKSRTTLRSFSRDGSFSTKERRRSAEPCNAIQIDEDDEIEVLETHFSRKVNKRNNDNNSLESDIYIVHEEPAKPGVRLRSHRRKSIEQANNRTIKSNQNCETLSPTFGSGLKKVLPSSNSHVSKVNNDGGIARKMVHGMKAHLHHGVNGPKELEKNREFVENYSYCETRAFRPEDSVRSGRQDYLFNRIEVGSGDADTQAGKGGTKRKSDEEDDSDSGFKSRPKKKHAAASGKAVWQMVSRKEKKPEEPIWEGNTKINRQKIVIKISKKLLTDQPETKEPENNGKRKEPEMSSRRHSWKEGRKMEVSGRDEGCQERRIANRVEEEPKEKREKVQVNGRGAKAGSSSTGASERLSSLPDAKQDKTVNDTNRKNGRENKANSKSMSSDLLKDLKKLKAHGIKQGDLPWVKDLLGTKHVACLSEVCAALTKFMDSKDHKISLVVEMGFCPVLVNLLRSESSEVISSALLAVSHIVSGNDYQTQAVLECSPLPLFCNFLSRHKHDVTLRKEACLALSNITAGTSQQIQHLVNDGLFPVLLSAMQHDEFQVMYEATWAVANATVNGSPEQIRYIVKQGFFQAFSEILKHDDDTLIQIALDAMYNVLKLDTKHKNAGKTTPYCRQVKEFGGLQRIRSVRLSGSTVVKKKAYNMLTTFFPDF